MRLLQILLTENTSSNITNSINRIFDKDDNRNLYHGYY